MRKKTIIIAALAVAAVGLYFAFSGKPNVAANAQPPAVAVSAIKIAPSTIDQTENLPGRVNAYKVSEVRPQINGIILKRNFVEGSMVKEGEQLYQIDPALYNAAYESAKADLQRANANAKSVTAKESRYSELVRIGAVSRQEFDDIRASLAQAQADIAVAKANLATAKINLDYTKVYAPISGHIGKSSVTEGALVTANQAQILTQVTQLDPIYVDMTQSASELMRIRGELGKKKEHTVTITLDNGETYGQKGILQFSDVNVDETTGSVQMRALFPNPDGILLPGMFVQAALKLDEQEVILIPQKAAIRDKDGGVSAWVIGADNKVTPVPIQTSGEYKDQWIVTSGLKTGDAVVTEGFQKIRPGAVVEATFPAATDAPAQTPPDKKQG
jgi:membrane fusion protein (multidrug efflux system)